MENKKKIEIDNFLGMYDKLTSDVARTEYLKKAIYKNAYVCYMTKCYFADQILANSYLDKDGNIKANSTKKYLMYVYSILDLYTVIKIDPSNITESFDKLESRGLVTKLFKLIPESEIIAFDTILKMKQDDLITNNYEIHSYINKKLAELYPYFGDKLGRLIDSLTKLTEEVDTNTLIKMMSKLTK